MDNCLKPLDYAIFASYLIATVVVGLIFSRGQKNLRGYFLADKSMGFVLVGVSVLAALFSGISYLAFPSEMYAHGVGFFLVTMSLFIATPLTSIIFLPFFCRSRFFTAYQYLEERFSVEIRTLASFLFIVQVLVRLALATYAPALALQQVTGLPLWFTVLATGILTTLYTTFGGIKAVIWTDVIQFVVLMGGQILILLVALAHVPGGARSVYEMARVSGHLELSLDFSPTVRITVWSALIGGAFLTLVQLATDQISVQRYLTATSLGEARRALWLKLALVVPVVGIFCLTGLVLFAYYRAQGDPLAAGKIRKLDQILPYFVAHELPVGIPGLLIAAIYGATMAAVSSGINSLTSATLVDFYERLWPGAKFSSEESKMKLARWLTVGYGLLVVILAFEVQKLGTLVEAANKAIGLLGGPLLGMFLLGIFSNRANARGVACGWLAGVMVLAWVCFSTPTSFLWYALTGCVVTVAVGVLASRLFPAPPTKKLAGLTWESRYQSERQN